jgi:hypothetical protein
MAVALQLPRGNRWEPLCCREQPCIGTDDRRVTHDKNRTNNIDFVTAALLPRGIADLSDDPTPAR